MVKNSELNALISLLDDPDENILIQVKEKIRSLGNEVVPFLKETSEMHDSIKIQNRLGNIIKEINLSNIYNDLLNWEKNDEDLLNGFFLITRYQFHNIEEDDIRNFVKLIVNDVWLEINENLTALEKVRVLNHIFFDIYNFTINEKLSSYPNCLFLNNILKTKKGTNLSLSILYTAIAQSLNIPICGVGLPEHLILAYKNDNMFEDILNDNKVLFYIDIANKGLIFSKVEIDNYLKKLNVPPKKKYYSPISNKNVIVLLIEQLKLYFEKNKKTTEVDDLNYLKNALV